MLIMQIYQKYHKWVWLCKLIEETWWIAYLGIWKLSRDRVGDEFWFWFFFHGGWDFVRRKQEETQKEDLNMHGLVNSTSWGRYSFCYLCYTRQDKKQMLNKEGKTLMTHFLIREKATWLQQYSGRGWTSACKNSQCFYTCGETIRLLPHKLGLKC